MYVIRCRVSGGVTGTREAPLKSNGQVKYFETYEEAQAEAARLTREMNGPHRTAEFSYTALPSFRYPS